MTAVKEGLEAMEWSLASTWEKLPHAQSIAKGVKFEAYGVVVKYLVAILF